MNMMNIRVLAVAMVALPFPASAATLCTLVADLAGGRILIEEGNCGMRATPASTFKIPLAVMGFDSGFLAKAHAPNLPFKSGYPDWAGEAWRQPTDPTRWMKYSVVWYSQRITEHLGTERFGRYVAALGYGNADISGDPGKQNALERSWISSSLKISPREQVDFLARLLTRELPVSKAAIERTIEIVEGRPMPDGWQVSGKTGGAYPRNADGSFNRARGWGWYVGWARKDAITVVFARLTQDERRQQGSPGLRARDAFLADWPRLARTITR